MKASGPVEPPWLVIGYGNTLRRDDGAGVRVAEAVEALGLVDVCCIACHQLTPELVPSIAAARGVVFVDAAFARQPRPRWRRLRPASASAAMAHAADPPGLLHLAQVLFGQAPPGWLLTLPAPDLGYGEELSPDAREGVAAAVGRLRKFLQKVPSSRAEPAAGRRH